VRSAAVSALGASSASPAVDSSLAGALGDSSSQVRAAIVSALGTRRASSFRDAIQARADDANEDLYVRIAATTALGDLCDPRSLDRLTELAHGAADELADEPQARMGAAAIEALGKIHPADLAARLAPLLAPNAPRAPHALATRVLHEPGGCAAR
jgi:HEAT repeat protein